MGTIIEKIQNLLPDIVTLTGVEHQGAHPVHGSVKTGKNFSTERIGNKWYCYRCTVGGYSFHWIAIQNGLLDCKQALDKDNFRTVLEQAAKYVGLEEELSRSYNKINEDAYYQQNRFYHTLITAQQYFITSLENNSEQYDYIKNKWGFNNEQISKLGIGYSPLSQIGLSQYLATQGFTRKEILRSGLIHKYKNNTLNDVFRGSITLPYLDSNNNPLFFIGRDPDFENKLEQSKTDKSIDLKYEAKYRKQLVHVHKHPFIERDILEPVFGQSQLEKKNRNQIPFIVVAEGITDAMTLQIWNIPVLSPVTTGFSKNQIQIVIDFAKQYECPVYICFDNEESLSGMKGALRTIDEFPEDIEVFYAEIPLKEDQTKIDINEYYLNGATEKDFANIIDKAIPKTEAQKLWKFFRNPYCIDRLINHAYISTNSKPDAKFILGKELYYTMGKDWESTAKIIKNSSKTTLKPESIEILKNKIYDLPMEEQDHSCKLILEYPFMRNLCKIDECLHVSDDIPESARIGLNSKNIYDKLFEIKFIRHPKEFSDKYYNYELKFPKEIFNSDNEYIDEQGGSLFLNDKELVKSFEFEIQFRALFDIQFKVPGEKAKDRNNAWDELVQHWFSKKQLLFAGEIVSNMPKIVEYQFLLFIDRHINRYLTFDLTDVDTYAIEDSIYFIPEKKMVFVPIPLVIKYIKEHAPTFSLTQLRTFLDDWLVSNTLQKIIKGYEILLWPFHYEKAKFPQITQFADDQTEMLKLTNELENEE